MESIGIQRNSIALHANPMEFYGFSGFLGIPQNLQDFHDSAARADYTEGRVSWVDNRITDFHEIGSIFTILNRAQITQQGPPCGVIYARFQIMKTLQILSFS